MAMTKEQQKAASDRIIAKEPLTEEEMQTYRMLTRKPEEYPRPGDRRECGVCGAKFGNTVNAKGEITISALEKFCDHQAEHNATPAQWGEAHKIILAGKEREKQGT